MPTIVIGKGYVSPLLQKLSASGQYSTFKGSIYCSSEEAVAQVMKKNLSRQLSHCIAVCKDKYKTRKLLRKLFSKFFFMKCSLSQLSLQHLPKGKNYIVKPLRGFFNIGVRRIDYHSNLSAIQKEITQELKNNTLYSECVLSRTELIIEEYVEGEEIAVDMYFNVKCVPQILNIYAHPIPTNEAYLNVLYYTSFALFSKLHTKLVKFFTSFNSSLQMSQFAIHAEFRISKTGTLIPIELNPMRFGGFGLADLTYYAFGINPYEVFLNNAEINWRELWKSKKKDYFGWVLGYNGTEIDTTKMEPCHDTFRKEFTDILQYREFDHKTYPVFATLYVREPNKKNLDKITRLDFNSYFKNNE